MKRTLIMLSLIFGIVAISMAQDAIKETYVGKQLTFTGTDAFGDTLTDTGTILRYFQPKRMDAYFYIFQTTMDETSGTSGCHIQWAGSLDGANGWTAIGSADTLTADGTVTESSLSTPLAWPFLRCTVTGYGTTTWDLSYITLRFVGKNEDD